MAMHRMLGYNFRVKEVRHLMASRRTQQVLVEVDLQNAGIAPFYKKWNVPKRLMIAIVVLDTIGRYFVSVQIVAVMTKTRKTRNLQLNQQVLFHQLQVMKKKRNIMHD